MTVCNHKSIPTAHFIPNSLSTFLHNPLTATAAAVRVLFVRVPGPFAGFSRLAYVLYMAFCGAFPHD